MQKFNPYITSPTTVKEGLFDGLDVEDAEERDLNESDILRGPSTSKLVSKLTQFVLMKSQEGLAMHKVVEEKKLKERIFEDIFEKFTTGERLQSYAEYRKNRDKYLVKPVIEEPKVTKNPQSVEKAAKRDRLKTI